MFLPYRQCRWRWRWHQWSRFFPWSFDIHVRDDVEVVNVAISTPSLSLTPSIHGPSLPFCEIKRRVFTSPITWTLNFTLKHMMCFQRSSASLCTWKHGPRICIPGILWFVFRHILWWAFQCIVEAASCHRFRFPSPPAAKRRNKMDCRPNVNITGPLLNTRAIPCRCLYPSYLFPL